MIDEPNIRKLELGVCVPVTGHRFSDVLVVEAIAHTPKNSIFGRLLSTAEKVCIIFVKNRSGHVHLKRAHRKLVHLDMIGMPLPDQAVSAIISVQQTALDSEAATAQERAQLFKKNSRKFLRTRRSAKQA